MSGTEKIRAGKYIEVLLFAGILSPVLWGCMGMSKDPNAPMAKTASMLNGNGMTGLEAFQSSFHTFARANCLPCHGDNGSQSQHIAVSDVSAAYAASKGYVNFNSPGKSLLVTRSDDGHCSQASCSGKGQSALAEIQTWASAELAAQNANQASPSSAISKYMTTPMTVPSTLPSLMKTAPASYTVLRWPLSQLTPSNSLVSSAIFELEIQLISAMQYHLRNPRIIGASSPVAISGIHLFLKQAGDATVGGLEDPYGKLWNNLDATAAPVALPGTLPAGPITAATPLSTVMNVMTVLNANSPPNDQITVGFDDIKLGQIVTATFASINSLILQPKCVGCHNPANLGGGIDYSSYAAVLNTVVPGNPGGSGLYTSVSGGAPTMPKGTTKLNATEVKAISDWITGGAPNN